MLNRKIHNLPVTLAQQPRQIEKLTTRLKENAVQIEKSEQFAGDGETSRQKSL